MYEKTFTINGKIFKIATNTIAKQANSSVLLSLDGTTVITTIVITKITQPQLDEIIPLLVDYRERTYAVGKIPGGFFKREGKPRDHEIITSRLIDRAVRPLIPKNIGHEIQISSIVVSYDGENSPSLLSLISSLLALKISEIPLTKTIACVKVSKLGQNFILNPTSFESEIAEFDLTLAGDGKEITMLDFQGNQIDETTINQAINFSNEKLKILLEVFEEIYNEIKPQKLHPPPINIPEEINQKINTIDFTTILNYKTKREREKIISLMIDGFTNFLIEKGYDENIKINAIKIFNDEMKKKLRKEIINKKIRPDGRSPDQIREISCQIGLLPRVHGSALFTRGETQSLATVTLGTPQDMQVIDDLQKEYKDRFIFHYNFPGFATGELKPDRAPSRREVGHGILAKKSIKPLLPDENSFPYTIRIVSDILESNGSSSMASVCGSSLALFDAGVPIKSAIAGVAFGLIKENNDSLILADLIGLEDNIGDMDLKVAGTQNGVTAIQLDLKIPGIKQDLLMEAIEKAKKSRLQILEVMNSYIKEPKKQVSEYAPKIITFNINPEKIPDLIGPGGKNIKQIIELTTSQIEIQPSGKIILSAPNYNLIEKAKDMISKITEEIEIGKIYRGKVTRVENYGIFVEILPGKVGLLHISKFAGYKIKNIRNLIKEGDEITVKVIDVDEYGRPSLAKY